MSDPAPLPILLLLLLLLLLLHAFCERLPIVKGLNSHDVLDGHPGRRPLNAFPDTGSIDWPTRNGLPPSSSK